jgi:hypothetical protein
MRILATPAAESAKSQLKPHDTMKATLIEIAHKNVVQVTIIVNFSDCEFFKINDASNDIFHAQKREAQFSYKHVQTFEEKKNMLSQQLQIIPTQRKTQKSNWLQT